MKRLIVNADDFGLHKETNKGIIKGYRKGLIRSTSLMPNGRAFDDACRLALGNPDLGIGIHITLVAENPVLPASQVPTLLGSNGKLHADHMAFIKKYVMGKINKAELYAEIEAQIKKAVESGVNITHVDSHQHLHVLPGIASMVIELAQKYGIKRMRFPGEAFNFMGSYPAGLVRYVSKCGLTTCAMMAREKARNAGISTPDYFFGMMVGGHLEEKYFMELLDYLPDGTSEIMIHPGADNEALGKAYDWQYHWEDELASVLSKQAVEYIEANDIQLISFKEL